MLRAPSPFRSSRPHVLARPLRHLPWLLLILGLATCESPAAAPEQEVPPARSAATNAPTPPKRVAEPGAPEGFQLASVVGVTDTDRGQAIVLQAGHRALPIFVGESEGFSIQLRLSGERFHRPLTHDLMDAVLAELGGSIVSVRVDRYEEDIFYSVIVLEHDAERRELDSRTSDAIALALGHQVPIYVRTSVLESSSIDLHGLYPDGEPTPGERPTDGADTSPLAPGVVSL